ncbi:MAG: response regulator transcription factor [Endomicrobiales bacterium]|nr:response regulator transcription factor [Endomicrobiales bacterium]
MNALIAILEDEKDILKLVELHLKKAGFKTKTFASASGFLRWSSKNRPDLIILDLMLPDADGLEICKELKKDPSLSRTPVIMLTARAEETDKIIGLELGADDYVTKPFSPKELVARVKVVLRRIEFKSDGKKIAIGGSLTLYPDKFSVRAHGKEANLTTTEYKILELLASKKGWVFSREKILDYLWGEEKIVVDRTIDVHINHLREKLGKAGQLIKNVRGMGYKIEE